MSLNLIELEKERMAWSIATFPKSTAYSSLQKLKDEIEEIEVDVLNHVQTPLEYVDAMMCLFDSAGRQGITLEELIYYFEKKLRINQRREWKENPNGTYSHIKKVTNGNNNTR